MNKISMLFWPGLVMFATVTQSQDLPPEIPLYNDSIPNHIAGPNIEKTEITKDGMLIIEHVSVPTIRVFLPPAAKATGTAIVIYPGGGYHIIAARHEGYDVAKALNQAGIAAIVLKYRLPDNTISPHPELAPMQDGQQALIYVRMNAKKWNIHPNRVGIMGFSAGGHLASTVGTHFVRAVTPNPAGISVRPDFMILAYPVISADVSIAHGGSFENLLGPEASPAKLTEFSNEKQVTANTPPTFIVHSSDDLVVKPANSIVFYEALLRNKVDAELHIYEKGGHGYGLNNPTSPDKWLERCLNWMQTKGWLNKK